MSGEREVKLSGETAIVDGVSGEVEAWEIQALSDEAQMKNEIWTTLRIKDGVEGKVQSTKRYSGTSPIVLNGGNDVTISGTATWSETENVFVQYFVFNNIT